MVPSRRVELDVDSLERLVPDAVRGEDTTARETLELHLARYEFAARHVGGRVLDIACGVGYGSHLLATRSQAELVIGVDCEPAAIAYARQRYGGTTVQFVCGDAAQFSDPDGFDAIVSLETIEHLPDPEGFLAHAIPQLRPGGAFVASVPTTPSVDVNPYHKHDFTERSFRQLVGRHGVTEIDCFREVQPVRLATLIKRDESRTRGMRQQLPRYYVQHPGSLARRIWATLRYGFANHYITIAWRIGT